MLKSISKEATDRERSSKVESAQEMNPAHPPGRLQKLPAHCIVFLQSKCYGF
jgi:hypothetical protein